MARKETKSHRWIKSHRVGEVTLFVTARSPYWYMYWTEREPVEKKASNRLREFTKSTRETDLSLACIVAARMCEELAQGRSQSAAVEPRMRL